MKIVHAGAPSSLKLEDFVAIPLLPFVRRLQELKEAKLRISISFPQPSAFRGSKGLRRTDEVKLPLRLSSHRGSVSAPHELWAEARATGARVIFGDSTLGLFYGLVARAQEFSLRIASLS